MKSERKERDIELEIAERLHLRHDKHTRAWAHSLLDGQRKEEIEQFYEMFKMSPREYLTTLFPPEPKTRCPEISWEWEKD